jgi:hypothetical protein
MKGIEMKKYVEIYTRNIITMDRESAESIALAIEPSEPNTEHVCYITVQEGENWKEATEKCSIVGYFLRINEKGELTLVSDKEQH